jgi:hypothetical protein
VTRDDDDDDDDDNNNNNNNNKCSYSFYGLHQQLKDQLQTQRNKYIIQNVNNNNNNNNNGSCEHYNDTSSTKRTRKISGITVQLLAFQGVFSVYV